MKLENRLKRGAIMGFLRVALILELVGMIGSLIHVEQEKSYRNVSKGRFCRKCQLSLSNTLQVRYCPEM
jgi:hypothetical protein